MIDYEKLKIAHELLDKNKEFYLIHTHNSKCTIEIIKDQFELLSFKNKNDFYFVTCNLDELISKLQELTKPQPKYELWQEIYYLCDGEITKSKVYEIDKMGDAYLYRVELCGEWLEEKLIYPSKESLIEAQIEHWQSLKNQYEIKPRKVCQHCSIELASNGQCGNMSCIPLYDEEKFCDHESDGRFHCITPLGTSSSSNHESLPYGCKHINKCKKCGEFY